MQMKLLNIIKNVLKKEDEKLNFNKLVKEWLEINKLPILMYWTGVESSSAEILKLIKSLEVIKPQSKINKDWE